MNRRYFAVLTALVGCVAALAGSVAVEVAYPGRAGLPALYREPSATLNPNELPLSSHAVLLTRAQWENTVRDLLRLQDVPGLSAGFPGTPAPSGPDFGVDSSNLFVGDTDAWGAYRDAAETLARRVVEDPAAVARILPDPGTQGDIGTRVRRFVTEFLPRAYRRPVEDTEIGAMVSLGEHAAASNTASDPFLASVRWIVTAVLQSPSFLYRIEAGVPGPVEGRLLLTDYELAAKLSYTLWGTMPDETLTEYAKSKTLATRGGVAAVVREMLDDPRAEMAIMDFHEKLFDLDRFEGIVRQTGAFPTFYPDFGMDAREDARLTISDLVVDHPGTLNDLYSSDIAYVNANLAKVYGIDPATISGLEASPDSFFRVKMPNGRAGILMHVGWLAMEAHADDPSPIQRGVFMARHTLCIALGSPPPGALNTAIKGPPGATNRGRVEATTQSVQPCVACHGRVINPMGFAFEAFDAIGAFRTRDGASAVDTTGTTRLLGAFDGARDMLDAVRKTPNAHACYVAHWSAYLNGTATLQPEARWLSPIVDQSMKGATVRDIIAGIVQTDAFLTVSR